MLPITDVPKRNVSWNTRATRVGPLPIRQIGQVQPTEADGAVGGRHQSGHQGTQRRLAAAGRADERHGLTRCDHEVDA